MHPGACSPRCQPVLSATRKQRLDVTERFGMRQHRGSSQAQGNGVLERDGSHYTYCLTSKGVEVAFRILFVHKRVVWTSRRQSVPPSTHHSTALTAVSRLAIVMPTRDPRIHAMAANIGVVLSNKCKSLDGLLKDAEFKR